jgi:hypothetical protein
LGGGEERERRSGGAWKDGMVHTVSLNGIRPSEKTKVLEKALPDIQGLKFLGISEHTFTHTHTHTHTHHAQPHAASAGVCTAV